MCRRRLETAPKRPQSHQPRSVGGRCQREYANRRGLDHQPWVSALFILDGHPLEMEHLRKRVAERHAEAGNLWGPYSTRHGAAQAYLEAIDPSPDATARYVATGEFDVEAYWAEKRIPLWLRYGAAMYVERFVLDPGLGDAEAIRAWSLGELRQRLALSDEQEVAQRQVTTAVRHALAGELAWNRVAASGQDILVAGALVAFLMEGGEPDVLKAHGAFQAALAAGRDTSVEVVALEAALLESVPAMVRFARQ